MAKQPVSAGDTGLVVRSKLNQNFDEVYRDSSKINELIRLTSNHEAIFDIDERAINNSGRIYDLFDGSNNRSAGILDKKRIFSNFDINANDTQIESKPPKLGETLSTITRSISNRTVVTSPDGSLMAVTTLSINTVDIYDTNTYEILTTIDTGEVVSSSIAPEFSKNNAYIAIVASVHPFNLRIYRTSDWGLEKTINTSTVMSNNPIVGFTWSSESLSMYFLALGRVFKTNVSTLTTINKVIAGRTERLSLSKDGNMIAVAWRFQSSPPFQSRVYVLSTSDLSTLQDLPTFSGDNDIRDLLWSPSGDRLITIMGNAGEIDVWDTSIWTRTVYNEVNSSIARAEMSQDGKFFLTYSLTKGVTIYDFYDNLRLLENIKDGIAAYYYNLSKLSEQGNIKKLFICGTNASYSGIIVRDFSTLYETPDFAYGSEITIHSQDAIENVKVISVSDVIISTTPIQNSHTGEISIARSIGRNINEVLTFEKDTDLECYFRYSVIAPMSQASEIKLWTERHKDITVECYLSIVGGADDENYILMTKTQSLYSNSNTDEDYFIESVEASGSKIAIKIKITRLTSGNNNGIVKMLGAIS